MTHKLRVISVEDNPTDALLVSRNLTKAGLDVDIHRVETEPDFVSALDNLKPDLIISDFSLPQFDGLRALEVAVERVPETPFIFVSGTIGEERAIDALRRGATDYVLKGNLSRLAAAVERAMREVALRAARTKSEQQRRDQEVRLKRLSRTYRMLSSTGSAILRLRNRSDLFDEVCRIAVHQGGYGRVAISLIDANARTLKPEAGAGLETPALRAGELVEMQSVLGTQGMSERAFSSGVPSIHNDLADESRPVMNREVLLEHGFHAAAALPLMVDDTPIGVVSLFSGQRGVFDEAEMDILLELTANLGFALQYLEKDEAVQFLSYFDSLTGLAKRPLFCQRLARLMADDKGERGVLTVVVFDVQKLGAINDSLGRYVGDRMLEKVANRIKEAHENSECAGYFGGGTFALMVRQAADSTDTGRLLQSAAAQLFVEPFQIDEHEIKPAIRSGVAFYPHDADSADALVQNAEAALSAAREDNEKYMLYGFVTQRPTSRTLALEGRLARALERNEFRLHYQPKVSIADGSVEGFEALLRWEDGQEGLVPPNIFIPLLERSGAIVDVGEWVIQQAVRDNRAWMAEGLKPFRVAVNVSPLQLRRRDFVDRVLAALEPGMKDAGGVDIEITESMLMQDLELSIRKLTALREA
ncbi:MAG TPA: EAL domain-containing protein, partial [Steroidobacteraceae bacterium]|nr:EAL domain-containing protein [Steroidobacteraceae bacterium]